MIINNKLIEDSFKYDIAPINERLQNIYDLSDILEYCNQINEKIYSDATLMNIEVIEGITFSEWLFESENDDVHQLFLELYNNIQYDKTKFDKKINISLGIYEGSVWNRDLYVNERRNILSKIKNPNEYEKFMHSCFIESVFSESVTNELCHHIDNFASHTVEITNNLAYLNDNAVRLHKEHLNNTKEAIAIINSHLMKCSDDPAHKKDLYFKFEYDKNGIREIKKVLCSVHTKLVRADSNLRIYFNWCDNDIDSGNKVLIGLIGRHPY